MSGMISAIDKLREELQACKLTRTKPAISVVDNACDEIEAEVSELLRKMLDERGVKWWEGEDERKTHWVANGLTWEYFNDENGDAWLGFLGACENDVTPDQAIAATLGNSTLTAEQVQKVIYKHGINDGFVYSILKGSFQAIADELNAELLGGDVE